jgi:hypothetical protein
MGRRHAGDKNEIGQGGGECTRADTEAKVPVRV